MPRLRRRRRPERHDWREHDLAQWFFATTPGVSTSRMGGVPYRMRGGLGPDEVLAVWQQIREGLLAEWAARHPGTRPWAWWLFDNPHGRPWREVLDERRAEWRAAHPLLVELYPNIQPEGRWLYGDLLTRPQGETERTYLARHGLLFSGEGQAAGNGHRSN